MSKSSRFYSLARMVLKKITSNPKLLLNPKNFVHGLKALFNLSSYTRWLAKQDFTTMDHAAEKKAVELKFKPLISVILVGSDSSRDMDPTAASINSQIYHAAEILNSTEDQLNIRQAINSAVGDYILFTKSGDLLYPNTLFLLVAELNREENREAVMIFSDHDYYKSSKRLDPYFKPGWSPDLFLVNNYIYRSCLLKKTSLQQDAGQQTSGQQIAQSEIIKSYVAFVYDKCLHTSETGKVLHYPGILFSYPRETENINQIELNNIRLQALSRRKESAKIELNQYSVPTVIRELPIQPLISIIIPTCFKQDLIYDCLKSIFSKSTCRNFEVLILDNSRTGDAKALKRLKEYACKVISIKEPFNWARLNNIGAQHAKGQVYVFLNDDTEVITDDWLERLTVEALRPEIGVVGPMLLFSDDTIQEAGMFLVDNSYGARHCFAYLPQDYTGYHNLLHYQRDCMAVTGACHVISKSKFEQMGGYDENFGVVGNDVDICLRLWQKGYYNLYLPEVEIIHKEKASRQNLSEEQDVRAFMDRWVDLISKGDPFYNKYLSQTYTDFRLRT